MAATGLISADSIARVREVAEIVEVVRGYLQLKRSGQNWLAVCPFHDDHDPSMNVSEKFSSYRCFACGAKGSVFDFVMFMERMDFREAVEFLAERYSVELSYEAPEGPIALGASTAPEFNKNELRRVNRWAAEFFRRRLASPEGAACRAYLQKRQISEDMWECFGVGYAPGGWEALVTAALRKGIPEKLLLKAGLAAEREGGRGGLYDRFRDRLVFPIRDGQGEAIAFGARSLDGSEPKYLNSPETPLFAKRRQLYGLDQLRDLRDEPVLVMEGYTDVLMARQQGACNAVATLGTALTEQHARTLSRYAKQVILVFDGDAAGLKAAERGGEVFAAVDLDLKVAVLPEGQDPCDFLIETGVEGVAYIEEEARDFLDFAVHAVVERSDVRSVAGKAEAADQLLSMVAPIANSVKRGLAMDRVSRALSVAPADLERRLLDLSRPLRRRAQARPSEPQETLGGPEFSVPPEYAEAAAPAIAPARRRAEKALLRGLLAGRRPREGELLVEDFVLPLHRRLFESWLRQGEASDAHRLLDGFSDPEERRELNRLLPDEEYEARDPQLAEAAFMDACRYLVDDRRRQEIEDLKRESDLDSSFDLLYRRIREQKSGE
jgi:DNA primase